MRILVVDDEPAVREAVERALRLEGHDVALAADGGQALDALDQWPPDAVVLDVLMPRVDGLEACRRMRLSGDRTPVLMLTARDAVRDRVAGLDAGADDYLVKPFALEELLARVRALLRRASPEGDHQGPLRYSDLVLDPVSHEVTRGGRAIELTRTEFLLLELFLRHPRQVLTRSVIFENVWGYDFGPRSNSLEVYMGYLRRKTEAGGEPQPLSGDARYVQLVSAEKVIPQEGAPALIPPDERARRLAAAGEGSYFSDVQIDGVHARVFTRAIEPGLAVQAAQSVEDVDEALDRLALLLGVVRLGRVGL